MRAIRGDVGGWSKSSTRSNTRFLYSVDERRLTGYGYALTLTLRTCPPTHEDWHRLLRALKDRLRRMGMIRLHWITEWQRRGVPHLHMAIWLDVPDRMDVLQRPRDIVHHWLELAAPYGAGIGGQHAKMITDSIGWFKYLAKHAVRGLGHYQRSQENIPPAWEKTGRMWGKSGDWPVIEVRRFYLDDVGHFIGRRVVRGYARSRARDEVALGISTPHRITWARGLLRCNERVRSNLRGVNDWADSRKISGPLLLWLLAEGHQVDPPQPAGSDDLPAAGDSEAADPP